MGKRGRPLGYRLSEESKRAIAESKRGQRQKPETREKISRSLTIRFKQFNLLSEEIQNKYCNIGDDELCGWANDVSDELDDTENVFTNKTMRNKRAVELTSGHYIEYFSHEMTPEFVVMLKDLVEEIGSDDAMETLMDLT